MYCGDFFICAKYFILLRPEEMDTQDCRVCTFISKTLYHMHKSKIEL